MSTVYPGPVTPAELGGCSARLKFTSSTTANRKARILDFTVAALPEGKGAEATVYRVEPTQRWAAEDYRALGIAPGTPLVARFTNKESAASPRRQAALRGIISRQRSEPDTMIGMVRIYGFGVVERINTKPVQDVTIYFDLMVFAGKPMNKCVGPAGKRWSLKAGEAAAALVPAAKALAVLHGINQSDEGRLVATAHRDIKPENMLVVWPESKQYRQAVERISRGVVPGHGLPLVQVGDLGGVRSVGTEQGVTGTGTLPNSGQWTPLDGFNGQVLIPSAADVWSFGAALFFAATGSHPWTAGDSVRTFDAYRFLLATKEPPDSPGFADLPGLLADLIRRCLAVDPAERPSMATVAVQLESVVSALGVFAGADTPTREIQVPLVAVPRRPQQAKKAPQRATPRSPAAKPDPFPTYLWQLTGVALVLIFGGFWLSSLSPHGAEGPNAAPTTSPSSAATSDPPQAEPVVTTAASPDPGATSTPTPEPVLGIGPWKLPQLVHALKEPRSNIGWAYTWALKSVSNGGDTTNTAFVFSEVIGAESSLNRPAYVLALTKIRNESSKSLTFDLSNCEITGAMDSMSKTGSGPSLLVSGPAGGIAGFSFKDGTGPVTALPACGNRIAKWAGPITVGAGSTWTPGNDGDYIMVFEMPPGSTAETHKPTGFLLKSTTGDVAFADLVGDWELRVPTPHSCVC